MAASDRILCVGGSKGIGRAVAGALGARAVVWCRRHGVDAREPAGVAAAATQLLQGGAPWGLVHTVGDFVEAPLLTTPPAAVHALVQSNLASVVHVVQAVVPAMVAAGRGRVVLFAAAGAGRGRAMRRAPLYFAIKAAVVPLARALAGGGAERGHPVHLVAPGRID